MSLSGSWHGLGKRDLDGEHGHACLWVAEDLFITCECDVPQRESLKGLLCALSGDGMVRPPPEEAGALPAASTLWVSELEAPGEYQAQPLCF